MECIEVTKGKISFNEKNEWVNVFSYHSYEELFSKLKDRHNPKKIEIDEGLHSKVKLLPEFVGFIDSLRCQEQQFNVATLAFFIQLFLNTNISKLSNYSKVSLPLPYEYNVGCYEFNKIASLAVYNVGCVSDTYLLSVLILFLS